MATIYTESVTVKQLSLRGGVDGHAVRLVRSSLIAIICYVNKDFV